MRLIEELEPLVGTEIGVSEWLVVTQDRIDRFADATDDHQWIHVDEERAAAGPFGATVAHGFLSLSLLPHLAPLPRLDGARMSINYGLDRVRFVSPVRVGSQIRARTVVQEAHEIDGGVHMKAEVTVELDGSDRPALVAETLTRYYT